MQKQADFLKIPIGEFIENRTQLFLQLFPSEYRTDKPLISSSLVPKKFLEKIEKSIGYMPEFFIALPMLVFKRKENGECTFYESNSGCTIYSVRPVECRLFPFISDKKVEDYSKLYPFCHGLKAKDGEKSYIDISHLHFRQVANYFGEVKEKGFISLWNKWPSSGVCLFTDQLLGDISEKEFFESIGELA